MKTAIKSFNQLLLSRLILCAITGWLVSSCFVSVNKKSTVRLTIQDSTGKPIPGFSLTLTGINFGFTRSTEVEKYYPTADQSGIITQALSWHDGIDSYLIFVGQSYLIDDCAIPKKTPTPGSYSIEYADDVSAVIRVRKVQ